MANDTDDDAAHNLLMAQRLIDNLKPIMPAGQATEAVLNGGLILIGCMATNVPVKGLIARAEAWGLLSFVGAMLLEERANGRKLTNDTKRARLRAIASLLRLAATKIDGVANATGKAKVDG